MCYNYRHPKYAPANKSEDTPTPGSYALLALNNHIFLSRFTFCRLILFFRLYSAMAITTQRGLLSNTIKLVAKLQFYILLSFYFFLSLPPPSPPPPNGNYQALQFFLVVHYMYNTTTWWCDLFPSPSSFPSLSLSQFSHCLFRNIKWCNKKKYILCEFRIFYVYFGKIYRNFHGCDGARK